MHVCVWHYVSTQSCADDLFICDGKRKGLYLLTVLAALSDSHNCCLIEALQLSAQRNPCLPFWRTSWLAQYLQLSLQLFSTSLILTGPHFIIRHAPLCFQASLQFLCLMKLTQYWVQCCVFICVNVPWWLMHYSWMLKDVLWSLCFLCVSPICISLSVWEPWPHCVRSLPPRALTSASACESTSDDMRHLVAHKWRRIPP